MNPSPSSPQQAIEDALASLRAGRRVAGNIVHWHTFPAQPAQYAPFPAALDPAIAAVLKARGIERLYTHQREVYDAVRAVRGLAERRLAEIDSLVGTYLKARDRLEAVPQRELLQRARKGDVVVIDVRPLGTAELKGRSETTEAFELLSVRSPR